MLGCSSEPKFDPSVFEGEYVGVDNPDDVLAFLGGQYKQGAGQAVRTGTYTEIIETQPDMYQVTIKLTNPGSGPETDALTIQLRGSELAVHSNVSDTESFYKSTD